jgi:hypothetical protein
MRAIGEGTTLTIKKAVAGAPQPKNSGQVRPSIGLQAHFEKESNQRRYQR